MFGQSKIVEVEKNEYARVDRNLTVLGHDYKQVIVRFRRIRHIIATILIIIPNIAILVSLYRYSAYKERKSMKMINSNENRDDSFNE